MRRTGEAVELISQARNPCIGSRSQSSPHRNRHLCWWSTLGQTCAKISLESTLLPGVPRRHQPGVCYPSQEFRSRLLSHSRLERAQWLLAPLKSCGFSLCCLSGPIYRRNFSELSTLSQLLCSCFCFRILAHCQRGIIACPRLPTNPIT